MSSIKEPDIAKVQAARVCSIATARIYDTLPYPT